MKKKRILYLILLSFIFINITSLGYFDSESTLYSLLSVHGGGSL